MSDYPERDYGYPKVGDGTPADVEGPPTVIAEIEHPGAACPHCGCNRIFQIEVRLSEQAVPPQLRVPEGCEPFGVYAGCPACPWASPMMAASRRKPAPSGDGGENGAKL